MRTLRSLTKTTSVEIWTSNSSNEKEMSSKRLPISPTSSITTTSITLLLLTPLKLLHKHNSLWSSLKVRRLRASLKVSSKPESRLQIRYSHREPIWMELSFKCTLEAWAVRGLKTRPNSTARTILQTLVPKTIPSFKIWASRANMSCNSTKTSKELLLDREAKREFSSRTKQGSSKQTDSYLLQWWERTCNVETRALEAGDSW